MTAALTSIIIPTFGRPDRVKVAVESVFAQRCAAWELIVVCDGAQPQTEAALAPYMSDPRFSLITQAHAGVSTARNTGIARARGTWIAFLDDDDLWHSDKLAYQRDWMHATGYLASQCDELWIRHGKRVNPMKKHAKPSGWIFPNCVELCAVSPSAVMLNRHVLDTIGLFNTDFPVCEDYELWLRVSLHYPVGNLPTPLVTKFGGHADQLSRQHHSMDAWRVKALEMILQAPAIEAKPHWKEKAIQGIIERCKILAKGAEKYRNSDAALYFSEKQSLFDKFCKTILS